MNGTLTTIIWSNGIQGAGAMVKRVTVVIPAFNEAQAIGQVIESVRATCSDFVQEIIVIDDGSTDGTRQIVAAYGDRIKYIYQDNRGLAGARNTGILAAKGQYLAFLDADDVWLPDKLALEVKFLDTHPSVGLVYSNYTYFGSRPSPKRSGFESIPLPRGYALKELFMDNPISSSAVLIRKECFEKVGLFDESLRQCEDLDMWLRISTCFEVDHIDVPLSGYRLHERNMHLKSDENIETLIATQRKCLESSKHLLNTEDLKMMREYHYRMCRSLAFSYLNHGNRGRARKIFWNSLRTHPGDPQAYLSYLIALLPAVLVSWIQVGKRKLGMKPLALYTRR